MFGLFDIFKTDDDEQMEENKSKEELKDTKVQKVENVQENKIEVKQEEIKVEIKESNMASNFDDIKYQIFDGSDDQMWKFRLLNNLEYKECKEQAIRERRNEDTVAVADWNKLALKAKTIIISSVSNNQLEYLTECETALKMLTKLDNIYSTQSTALQIVCRNKLDDVKLKNYDTAK